MNKRDKFLTEAMGECWHQVADPIYSLHCLSCGELAINIDFSTWEGFGKLWEWSQEQDWWPDALMGPLFGWVDIDEETIACSVIHPDLFANAIYEYLKENKIGKI